MSKLWKWEIRDAWGSRSRPDGLLASGEAESESAIVATTTLLGLRYLRNRENVTSNYQFEGEWVFLKIYPPDATPYEQWAPEGLRIPVM